MSFDSPYSILKVISVGNFGGSDVQYDIRTSAEGLICTCWNFERARILVDLLNRRYHEQNLVKTA